MPNLFSPSLLHSLTARFDTSPSSAGVMHSLEVRTIQVLWIVSIIALVLAVPEAIASTLSLIDRYNQRKLKRDEK
ncbi:hypothetical protein KSZ_71850 [Dictyobacter formicarum]|uniref:CNNM transmembrane domain-containing protein n=1 Tax=Dictyobacter formicarum TaxID=2778368 RepID=A0ABQ3VU07_9CHLR|nr:hypothetical protein KSZ_71850 [Dictyobacter formicarum]